MKRARRKLASLPEDGGRDYAKVLALSYAPT
jgi:hypothetical protein